MALTKDQYKAFEDIVGPENINADPEILYSNAWRSGQLAGASLFTPPFEAIVLPGSTEEVQKIVRLCNKFSIQFKASSTHWGAFCDATGPGCIRLDMRRMNKIIEINEKNMYAVVESFVISAQLQAELMKRGFIFNMCGAGSQCSAMPLAAHQGIGHFSQTGSYGDRNLLGVEWVAPDGELVRMGSLGSSNEWFTGDGPGPSLRGVIRGNVAPLGGIGVFTKAAAKLYHWPGPAKFDMKGVSPRYYPANMPENFYIAFYSFPDIDHLDDAQQLIGEAELAYELMGFNAAMAAANVATSNEEDIALFKEFAPLVEGPSCLVIMAGNSMNDINYKRQVLAQIIEKTGGKKIPKILDDPKVAAGCIWRYIRSCASIRETFRATSCFGGQVGQTDVYRLMADYIVVTGAKKQDLIDRDLAYNDGISPFTQSFEHGHYGHGELLIRYKPTPEAFQVFMEEFVANGNNVAINDHYGVPGHVFGDQLHDLYGPHVSNYHLWMRKIKKSFDPKGASEGSFYITNKDE